SVPLPAPTSPPFPYTTLFRSELLDRRAEAARDLQHAAHVAYTRYVVEGHRLVGEEARRDERQRFVLVSRRGDLAVQRRAALDDEARHRGRTLAAGVPCPPPVGYVGPVRTS